MLHRPSLPGESIGVRRATLADRTAIHAVHTASIRGLCSTHYSAEEIERWAGFLAPDHYTAVIADRARDFVVAEVGGTIAGFGQAHLPAAEIEAIYVHPERVRKGVAGAILRHLEGLAVEAGLSSLRLTATLNAVPFYERQGFRICGRAKHAHPSGILLDCVPMAKELGVVRQEKP